MQELNNKIQLATVPSYEHNIEDFKKVSVKQYVPIYEQQVSPFSVKTRTSTYKLRQVILVDDGEDEGQLFRKPI